MRPIRWYLKGLFPIKSTSVMFGIFLILYWLAIYYSATPDQGAQAFVFLSFMLVNPFILLSAFLHVFRSKETTLFELSMLSSWRGIALARVLSSLIYVLTFWALQAVLLLVTLLTGVPKETVFWLVLTTLNSMTNYVSLGLVTSLTSNRTSSVVMGSLVFFLMPFSSFVVLQNYLQYNIKLSGPMAYLVYFFNPEATYIYHSQYPGFIDLQLVHGFAASLAISLTLMALYYFVFTRLQFKP